MEGGARMHFTDHTFDIITLERKKGAVLLFSRKIVNLSKVV